MHKVCTAIQTYWILITLFILCSITALSLSPLPQLPEIPGTDKTHHFIAYVALMFPAAFKKTRYWLLLAIAFVIYSGLIELIQPYVNRYGEWLDLLANTVGVAIGALLGLLAQRFFVSNNKER